MDLGSELITAADDRTFDSDTGWWTKYGTAAISSGVLSQTDTTPSGVYRDGLLEYGHVYVITFTISNYTGGDVGLAPGPVSGGYYVLEDGTYQIEFTHDGSVSGRLGLWSTDAGVTFDDMSLKEVLTTTYATDFSEYTTGVQPSDWTERWHDTLSDYTVETGGDLGGKVLQQGNRTGDQLQFFSWDTPGTITNVEVLAKSRYNSDTPNIDYGMGTCLRGTGTSTSETGYLTNFNLGEQKYNNMRYNSTSGTTLPSGSLALTHTYDQWVWQRFRIFNNLYKSKVWMDSDTEPETWTYEYTITAGVNNLIAPGYVGLFQYDAVADQFDYFALAIGGGTAPSPDTELVLSVGDASHAQAATSLTLAQLHQLAVLGAAHGTSSTAVGLVQAHLLGVLDAAHAQAATGVTFTQLHQLVTQDAAHAQAAAGVTLSQNHLLAIQDAVQAVSGSLPAFTQSHILIVSDSLHAALSECLELGDTTTLIPTPDPRIFLVQAEDRLFIITREDRAFIVAHEDRAFNIY